jgi:uncharacterized membrane protein
MVSPVQDTKNTASTENPTSIIDTLLVGVILTTFTATAYGVYRTASHQAHGEAVLIISAAITGLLITIMVVKKRILSNSD